MAGNDDKGVDDKGVDENGTSPRFSSRATSPRFSSRATSPRFSSNAAERGARAFAEMAASAAARVASHATPSVRATLSVSAASRARPRPLSEGKVGRRGGTRPTCRRLRARRRARWNPRRRNRNTRGTRATVWKRSRPRVDLICARRGTRWTRRTRDGEGARRRSSPRSIPSGRASRRRGCTVTSRRRRRPRRGDGEGGKHLSGKSLAAVAKAWARRASSTARPDEDAVAALVDALPNAERRRRSPNSS